MFRIDWSNPKVDIGQVETLVSVNLGGIYDGLRIENGYLYVITTSPMTSDQEDAVKSIVYSLNSQPTQIVVQSQPPHSAFASKTIVINGVTKSLFKRFTGTSFPLSAGTNTCTWTQSAFPWVKFLGIEVIGAELGDTCDLYVLDTSTGTYSGHANYPLNQFAYGANLAPGYYRHVSEYDSDMYQNLQIKFIYNSVSAKMIYINFDMNEVK
jgi:hypothetical protein